MWAQSGPLLCAASSVPVLARSEGVSEPLGDIVLQCSGGAPRTGIAGNLGVMLPVPLTNRVTADGIAVGVTLSVNDVPTPAGGRIAGQNLNFNGLNIPVPDNGSLSLRISGLRGNLSAFGATAQFPVQAYLSTSLNSVVLSNNPVTIALPQRGLLATFATTGIPCTGSPIPSSINLSQLFAAGTRFASTRITEGYPAAFLKRDSSSDTGTRVIVRYTGIPAGTRLFVPDAVAGSNSAQPTSGGDLGLPPSGGQYTPGSLLLVRVLAADPTGASGILTQFPASGTFNAVSEVTITGGTGYVVYEVVDSDAAVRESAQFPTFFGMPTIIATGNATETISFAPASSEFTASVSAPIPRFATTTPPSDCSALGDCGSAVFPKLTVNAGPIQFSSIQGGAVFQAPGYIPVQNSGGGVMPWVATVAYTTGDGWLKLQPASGTNGGSVRVYASPQSLAPGTYQASITIDAGDQAGRQTVPVTLLVSPAPALPSTPSTPSTPPATAPKASISSIYNAADARMSTLAPGAQATLLGSNFTGKQVSVAFDGITAKTLSTATDRIDVLVPQDLAGKTSAQVVVTVDGTAGNPGTVTLAAAAPGIFSSGVLNEDGTSNGDDSPAQSGSVLQILTTGLPADLQGVTVKLHDREGLVPVYAGAVEGRDGVQQIKVTIPGDLPTMPTEVLVCAGQACSWPARIVLQATAQ